MASISQTRKDKLLLFRLWRPQKFSPTLCARGTWYWNVAQTARASCRLLQQESLRPSCWSRTVTLRAANPQPGPDMVSSIMPIGTCQNLIIHKGFTCNTRSNLKYLYNNNLLIHLICFVQFGGFLMHRNYTESSTYNFIQRSTKARYSQLRKELVPRAYVLHCTLHRCTQAVPKLHKNYQNYLGSIIIMAYHLIGHESSVSMGCGKRSKGANLLIA